MPIKKMNVTERKSIELFYRKAAGELAVHSRNRVLFNLEHKNSETEGNRAKTYI